MKKIIIIGGHGPGDVIGQAIIYSTKIGYTKDTFVGFLNNKVLSDNINGIPILGGLEDVKKFIKLNYYFIYTIYKIGGQDERIKLFNDLSIPEDRLYTFIAPHSYVAPNCVIGNGCVILPNASISSNTQIGNSTLIMTNASIGHDNKIDAHCFFAANCCTGSWLHIAEGSWIGLNATIVGKVKLGKHSAIGIGATITKDVGENELWIGNPGRFHKLVTDKIKI